MVTKLIQLPSELNDQENLQRTETFYLCILYLTKAEISLNILLKPINMH